MAAEDEDITLHLGGSAEEGEGPTLDELKAMAKAFTGREATTEELEEAAKILAELTNDE